MNSKQLAFACAQVACDAKASDIAIYDLRGTSSITDFAVVCTATSVPHLRAIMGDVDKEVWEKYEISPVYAERTPNALWCVLDYIDVMLHVMAGETREFYELEALCMLGKQDQVMKEMKDYWGGMLAKGATSFWEKYIPEEEGRDILSMYGRPYGKSLCHAWGASPIYLLGRYYMGVQPTQAGYATWEARPVLSDMEWMEGSIPTPYGEIIIKMDREHLSISNPGGVGTIYYQDKVYTLQAGETLTI